MARTSTLGRTCCVVLLLAIVAGLVYLRSQAITGPGKPPVMLFYDGSNNCYGDPDPVYIWKDKIFSNLFKPHKVTWKVDDSVDGNYYWEITGKSGDYPLGPVDPIECNKEKTKSKKAGRKLPGDPLEWPYTIEVFSCTESGGKGDSVCKLDPRVHIQD